MDSRVHLQQNTVGFRIFRVFNTLLMLALCVAFLYPLLNVVATSMSSGPKLLAGQIGVLPEQLDLTAYRMVFQNRAIARGYTNSIFYAAVGTAFNLALISMVAYALSKRHLVFRGALSFLIAFTLLFSGGLIPTFLLVKTLGLYNTRAWMIASHFFQVFYIVMLRTFYSRIPASLEDSAKIDGYNDFQIMWKIYAPLSKPILATLALFSIVGYWNDYFTALIYLSEYSKYPLQMVIRDYLIPAEGTTYSANDLFGVDINELRNAAVDPIRLMQLSVNLKNAAIVVSAMPLVTVMMAVQRYFKKGVMIGALRD